MKKLLLLSWLILLVLPSAQAIRISDSLLIAIPPETVECIDISLPDDAGPESGLADYLITSDFSWGDLTRVVVTTDENNTVKYPVCFSSFGHAEGDCSNVSMILISSLATGSRSFTVGACASKLPDIETAQPAAGQSVAEALNSNADVFAAAFREPTTYLGLAGTANLTLLLESYAAITLEVAVRGALPAAQTVTLSPASPTVSIPLSATAAGSVTATATIRGCSGQFCSRTATATVADAAPPSSGFAVYLFPLSLDVKSLAPVTYELTLTNFGTEQPFAIDLLLPSGLSTDFTPQAVSFTGERTVSFSVTPANASTLYVITASVASGGVTKQATVSLSTNELLTDALRTVQGIAALDPAAGRRAQGAVDSWYTAYTGAAAGDDLADYGKLRTSLGKIAGGAQSNATIPPEPPSPAPLPSPEGTNLLPIAALAAAAVIAVAVLLAIRQRRQPPSTEPPEEW